MLNRFQFARLRGFRRGNKRPDDSERRQDERGGAFGQDTRSGRGGDARGADDVHDAWEDDDRVSRLLARRAAEQDELRRQAVERQRDDVGGGAPPMPPAGTEDRSAPAAGAPAAGAAASTVGSPAADSGAAARSRHPLAGGGTSPVDIAPAVSPERAPQAPERAPQAPVAPREDARTTTVPSLRPDPALRPAPVAASEETARPVTTPHQSAWRRDGGRTGTSARVVCVASGKGGTGKSVMATNLAILRARRGERVLLVDFDAGLANAHLLLGLAPPYDVGHVMEGEVSAQQALVEGPHGMKLLSGGVGRQTMIDPTRRELDRLFKALRPLESEFDLILIDHGAGLSYSTVAHLAATSTLILVTNHEVTALSDAYALYKRAHMVNQGIRVGMVINRSPDERMALDAWDRFRGAAHKFLGHTPEWIGWVPVDPDVPRAVQMRQPVVLSSPECQASRAFKRVAGWPPIDHARSAMAFYDKARRALR